MRNLTLLLVICFVFALQLKSQNSNWILDKIATAEIAVHDENIYTINSFTNSTDVDPSDSTEFIIVPAEVGEQSCYIRKLDANGNFLWAKSFGNDREAWPKKIISHNSGIYVMGVFDGVMDFDPGPAEFILNSSGSSLGAFIVKYDHDGNFLWAQHWYSVSFSLYGYRGQSFAVDNEGDLYAINDYVNNSVVCGTQTSFFSSPLYLTKYASETGECVFNTKLSRNGSFDEPEIVFDGNNHLYVATEYNGSCSFDVDTGTVFLPPSTAILKLDLEGNVKWAKSIGGEFLNSIHYTNGQLYVTGSYRGLKDLHPNPAIELLYEPTFTEYNFYVLQIDTSGIFNWVNTHFGAGDLGDESNSRFRGSGVTVDGDLILSGQFNSDTDLMPGDSLLIFESNISTFKGFLMSFDASGDLSWLEPLVDPTTPWGSIRGLTLFVDDNNNLYFTGYSNRDIEIEIEEEIYLPLENSSFSFFLIKHQFCNPTSDTLLLDYNCADQIVNGIIYDEEGIYTINLTNFRGCDSTMTIIIEHPTLEDYILIDDYCIDQEVNGVLYSEEGIYTQEFITSTGCDSILTIEIIYPDTAAIGYLLFDTQCKEHEVNGIVYSEEGIYTQNLLTNGDCDSILTIEIIYPDTAAIGYLLFDNDCEAHEVNGITYSEEGIYTQDLLTNGDCDSTLTIEIVYPNNLSNLISLVDGTLFLFEFNATYEWFDCSTNELISGESGSTFSPTLPGSYAASISKNGCEITTECIDVIMVSTNTLINDLSAVVYPTIFEDEFFISSPSFSSSGVKSFSLYNSQGQKVEPLSVSLLGNGTFQVKLNSDLPNGVYFFSYKMNTALFVEKLIKI